MLLQLVGRGGRGFGLVRLLRLGMAFTVRRNEQNVDVCPNHAHDAHAILASMRSRVAAGFALPTVLIAGIVMMIVLMTTLVAASGTRANFDSQYYSRLAREAAESGALFAQNCMRENDFEVTWDGGSLETGHDCNRGGSTGYIIETDTYRTKYIVANMSNEPNQNRIEVTGVVELLRRSTGASWRSYEQKLNVLVSSEVSTQRMAFGYGWGGSSADRGVYFGALTATGQVMGVGTNAHGQLGLGDSGPMASTQPALYQLPPGVVADKVRANFLSLGISMYVIDSEGRLFASGRNSDGMLTGSTNPIRTPQLVEFPPAAGVGTTTRVVEVSNLENATFVVLSDGEIYASGNCGNGKLGTGPGCSTTNQMTRVALPAGVRAAGSPVVADGNVAYVITDAGQVYGWGYAHEGRLGSPTSPTSVPTPRRIGTFSDVTMLSTDGKSLYILRANGQLWAVGLNDYRQIANNSTSFYSDPVQVNTGCSGNIIDAKTDHSHVAVLTSTGQVCTAGYNSTGQLGRGGTSSMPFGRVTLPPGVSATSLWLISIHSGDSGRMNNTFVVGSDHAVYGMGSNYYGQLGNGSSGSNATTPVKMSVFGNGSNEVPAARVQSGYGTTIITAQNGRIYAVGNNSHGQLGDGTSGGVSTLPRATRFLNLSTPSYF